MQTTMERSPEHDAEIVALLTEHQAALRLYVASLLPGDPEAADVAQQANSTIWKKRADFEPGTHFKAWVFAVARYEVLNYRKSKARASRLVFSDEMEDLIATELPEQSDDLEERHDALRACLAKLKPAQRELIRHRYFRGTSLQDYADEIGRSVGGLKVTLHRIRTALAACIEQKLTTTKGPIA